jgi:hypothetical protein
VLDWWHVAVRFEHVRQAARGLGAGTADASLAQGAAGKLDRAKWCLWHGRWTGCRRRLAGLCRWTRRRPAREVAGMDRVCRHVSDLLGYLERNQDALVPYAARRRCGEPISTAFVESAVCTAPGSLDTWLDYAAHLRFVSSHAARASSGLRKPFFSTSHSAL